MEWQQLEYFQIVAQLEHFTRAAEQLSVSQPTLSRSIAKLEQELGVPLFDRQGRQVKLNRYGELFYRRTSRVLQEITEAKRDIQELQDPERGTVSLAFLKTLGLSSVPNLVKSFLEQHPRVNFQLFQNSTSLMLDQLEAGETDFCLSSVTESRPGIEWLHLWTEDLYVHVPTNHKLADKEHISLRELAHERFVVLKRGYGSRTIFEAAFEQLGLTPNIAFEGEESVSVLGFVRAGLGITLLPLVSGVDKSGLTQIAITDPPCRRTIGIAWSYSRYLNPAAQQFRQYVLNYYGVPMSSNT
jgi:DNA-binding transcriptional LysR family regulator